MSIIDLFAEQKASLRPLYPDQVEALRKLDCALIDGHTRIMLMAATGFGKTLTAAHLIADFRARGKSVCFTVHRLPLVDQTVAAFGKEGLTFGVMQGDHPLTDYEQRLQVASIQTLISRLKKIKDQAKRKRLYGFNVFVIDEAHVTFKAIPQLMEMLPDSLFIGLSATPWSEGLGKLYSKLVIGGTTKDLIAKGRLSKFVVYAPTPAPDLRGVRTVAGEYNKSDLGEAMNKAELVGDIVETWIKRGEDRQTVAFCVNRAHARHIQECFVEAGVAAEYIDCKTKDHDRRDIIGRFHRGETRILCNIGVLTVGFDSDVRCIIDAHPTKSVILYVQTIGRGLRTADGKENCIILDHASNALRLGLASDIHYDALDDGDRNQTKRKNKERQDPLPILCDDCKAVIPRHSDTCPQCGARRVSKTEIVPRHGDLVLFGSGQNGNIAPSLNEKLRFYSELKGYAEEESARRVSRGLQPFKPGWAAVKFREKFGHWPNGDRIANVMPAPPSLATRNYVKSKAIAFAKSRAAHG